MFKPSKKRTIATMISTAYRATYSSSVFNTATVVLWIIILCRRACNYSSFSVSGVSCKILPWIASTRVDHILHLFTGSGCIAMACADVFPGIKVDALEFSTDAIAVARMSIKRH